MSLYQEQFSAATKAQFESQLAWLTALTGKAFESVEKVIDLNLNVAKASFEESTANFQQLLSVKDPQEFFALTAAQTQPNAEKALAYSRHLAGIVSGVQAEFTKAAELQVAETSRKVASLVEEVSKNAPAGSENAIAFIKSAIANSNAGYEQITKSTKQAVEALEVNINSAATQMVQNAGKVNGRASAAAKK
ncbi:MAG: phasin family protein [Herminiimonas sp.]|nr:phasin family protein [Herminiimonas sp.]